MGDAVEIKKETLEAAKKCPNEFGCLTDDAYPVCSVLHAIEDGDVFVEPVDDKFCSYLIPFGSSFICNCPARKEIFIKYPR